MSTFALIKLKNLTPLHLGTGRENYDFSSIALQSDTISAALAAIKAQQGETENLNSFLESFRISSAFPYFKDHYFLPKPIGKLNVEVEGSPESSIRKRLKKIKFMEWSSWNSLINGERLKATELQIQSDFFLDRESISEFQKPSISQVNQRVTISRDENITTTPFFFDWTYFDSHAGLYCLTDARGSLLNEIVSLFQLLGENGIGTDRNVGGGKFDVELQNVDIPSPKNQNATMLLSLYIPKPNEIKFLQLGDARYDLLLRGGYIAGSSEVDFRHLRKKSIYMFGVGSIFPTKQELFGQVVDLAPDWNDERMHPVWRSGKPFILPINI